MDQKLHDEILTWIRTVKFKRKLIGGVDYADVLKKLEELTGLYEAVIRSERAAQYQSFREPEGGGEQHDG